MKVARKAGFPGCWQDFFGMFERYLRFAPRIVLDAPTLPAVMQLPHGFLGAAIAI